MTAGQIGHFFVILSFVSSIVAGIGYFFNTQQEIGKSTDTSNWKLFSRIFFFIHVLAVLGIIFTLYYIIRNHLYEYHYAWRHSSNILPVHYMISCFWEGQEGSFLLWIFWHTVIGSIILFVSKKWEAPVLSIFSIVQAFLCSMILGILITKDFNIGSSPFVLFKDVMGDLPVFKMNPDYVPKDGNGLNALLQNYWMVIHPPTLFLGFALTLVPFSYCISGLYTMKLKEWVRPALPWTIFAALILGIGIMMGAYWAYETLNFGGYWNWDPVENAVYVPWLVLVMALHTMIIYKSSDTALRLSTIMVVLSFLLILYSTFLTRSGVLVDASVHAFTDLGLMGQLAIYMLFFFAISVVLIVVRWRDIPATNREIQIYSKELWLFIGVAALTLMSFHALAYTSIPVLNLLAKMVGLKGNKASPADPVAFFGFWQLIFSIAVVLVSATAQYFYWNKLNKENFMKVFYYPILMTGLLIIATLLILPRFHSFNIQYILLLIVCIYAIVTNSVILIRFLKTHFKFTGGAVAHIGIAVMLLGILYSAGFSKTVSLNNTGMLISKEMSDQMNKENSILYRNTPTQMSSYLLNYRGPRVEIIGLPGFFDKAKIVPLKGNKAVLLDDAKVGEKLYFKKGDTVKYYNENTYYQIDYSDTSKRKNHLFTLYPRVQANPGMGSVASPDIRRDITKDLYTHITYADNDESDREWSDMEEFNVSLNDTIFINDYVAKLTDVKRLNVSNLHGIAFSQDDYIIEASIEIYGPDQTYTAKPCYVIKDSMLTHIPETVLDLGLKVLFINIDPDAHKKSAEGKAFTIGVQSTQKDFIVMKASEKPMINLLWLGTGLVCLGLIVALVRRIKEAQGNL